MTLENRKKRSPLWYELPILLSIIGGIIAFVKIRKDDPKKAKICLILGIGVIIYGGIKAVRTKQTS